ncbi:MAG: ABC transporter ATP-binding protein [Pseudomonadota bacterium]
MNKNASGPPRLELIGLSRSFGAMRAVDAVSLAVWPGEICAVLGENGAGKSTLMNLLYGVLTADDGAMVWNGREVMVSDPRAAQALGIGMVFQHFSVLETMTVEDNIALALPGLDPKALQQRFSTICDRYRLALDLDAPVRDLSVGERQRLEIVRCLMQPKIELLILDEPTSVLTPTEVEQLFGLLREVAADGCSVLFISHKLPEVFALCSRALVLRRGAVSGDVPLEGADQDLLLSLMMDRGATAPAMSVTDSPKKRQHRSRQRLRVQNLSADCALAPGLDAVSFDACEGDIIGIAGVAGSGQDGLMAALSGEQLSAPESIQWDGSNLGSQGIRERRTMGWRSLPINRLGHAACPALNMPSNFLLTHMQNERFVRRGWIHWRSIWEATAMLVKAADVRMTSPVASANQLSGGTLQKFIVARELMDRPELLCCYNPSWGVDPGARTAIHDALRSAAAAGSIVIVISEDLDELIELCTRVGALYQGRLSRLQPLGPASVETLGRWMTGQETESAA